VLARVSRRPRRRKQSASSRRGCGGCGSDSTITTIATKIRRRETAPGPVGRFRLSKDLTRRHALVSKTLGYYRLVVRRIDSDDDDDDD